MEQLDPETSINWEGAARFSSSRVRASAGAFVNSIDGNVKASAHPGSWRRRDVTRWSNQSRPRPRPAPCSFHCPRYRCSCVRMSTTRACGGLELEGEVTVNRQIVAGGTFTYLEAEDTDRHRPPNIEGGTPAAGGVGDWVRFARSSGRWWVQPYHAVRRRAVELVVARHRRPPHGRWPHAWTDSKLLPARRHRQGVRQMPRPTAFSAMRQTG